jgi:arsenate reductase
MSANPNTTLYHNPNCSTSKYAVETAETLGADVEIVRYLKNPPDRATLRAIVDKLDGPVEDLVRKDANFEKLGLDPADYVGNPDAVVDVLVAHKELLQRPLLVRADKAIIGRPKDRVTPFLQGA